MEHLRLAIASPKALPLRASKSPLPGSQHATIGTDLSSPISLGLFARLTFVA